MELFQSLHDAYSGKNRSWQFSVCDAKSEFQKTVVLSQIATKANISHQFLPVNYILVHRMRPNPSDFSNTFFSDRIKTKTSPHKVWGTICKFII